MVGVIANHRLQILQTRGLGRVGLERRRGLVRALRGEHRGIEQRLRDRTRNLWLLSDQAAAQSNDAGVQDLVQRLNRLWSLDHLPEYAGNTAELTKLPEDVLLSAYTAQRTSPIIIDENIVKEVQEASDRATRYGILSRTLDVSKAVDRSFTAASAGSN